MGFLDLFNNYATANIIIIILAAFFLFIEIWKGIDYLRRKHNESVNEEIKEHKAEAVIEKRFNLIESRITKLEETNVQLEIMNSKIDLLLRDSIASSQNWFNKIYEKAVEQGNWISLNDLQIVEARFSIYKEEGGNGFVKDIVEKIRGMEVR